MEPVVEESLVFGSCIFWPFLFLILHSWVLTSEGMNQTHKVTRRDIEADLMFEGGWPAG